MTSAILCLLHHVADNCHPSRPFAPIAGHGHLCEAMPEARSLRLVESPGTKTSGDEFWLRLTPRGRHIVDESLATAQALEGEG